MTDQFDRVKTALADRYTIERELGAGGMATVYLARDLEHDRDVAVKVRKLPRVNPRLGQFTVAEATAVPNVGLPTDRRAAALGRRTNLSVAEYESDIYVMDLEIGRYVSGVRFQVSGG